MASSSNFPRPVYQLIDKSGRATFIPADVENLFAPLIPFFAEKGPVGQITYSGDVSYGDLYGTQMTTHGSAFYTLSNGLVDRALNGPNPVNMYGVRLADPNAKQAALVLCVTPTKMNIPQYQTDALGNRTLDANGKPIPLMSTDATPVPVVEPGIVLLWSVRPLATGETVSTAQVTTTTTGSVTTSTYPVLAFVGSSVGSLLNNCGSKFYRPPVPDTDIESRIGSVLYRFAPYYLDPALDTTAAVVGDVSNQTYVDVSFKPNAQDPLTALSYNFTKTLFAKYYDSNSQPLLDMSVGVYSENVKTVGDLCLAAAPELAGVVSDGWGIDLITATSALGIPYKHIAIDPNSAKVVSADVINYLQGGTDGDTSEAMFQSLLSEYISNANVNGFRNIGRYQFTHMFDPGWPLALKKEFISLLSVRQVLKLVVSTQDMSLPPNTMDQDLSTAEALMGVMALYPETMSSNLGAVRADVCYHTGKLASLDLSADPVPMVTYKRFDQLAQYHGGTYITGSPNASPGSYITEFRNGTINWVPDDEDQMSAAWANRAIYAMYASRNQLFLPAMRSVSTNDTSLTSGSTFMDLLIYRMKLCFSVWAAASGSDVPQKELFPQIQKIIQAKFKAAFGSTNTDTITLYQTADDANAGGAVHALITIAADGDLRKITFQFLLERTADAATTTT